MTARNRSLIRTIDFGLPDWWQAIIDDDSQTFALRRFRRGEPDEEKLFMDDDDLREAMRAVAPMDEWVAGNHDILH